MVAMVNGCIKVISPVVVFFILSKTGALFYNPFAEAWETLSSHWKYKWSSVAPEALMLAARRDRKTKKKCKEIFCGGDDLVQELGEWVGRWMAKDKDQIH